MGARLGRGLRQGLLHVVGLRAHLVNMAYQDQTTDPAGPSHDSGAPGDREVTSVIALVNALFVGVVGTYTATRSITITYVAGTLVAVVAVSMMVCRRRGQRVSGNGEDL
jgi:hypothetical protein